jgi:hypothetical protein
MNKKTFYLNLTTILFNAIRVHQKYIKISIQWVKRLKKFIFTANLQTSCLLIARADTA